MGQYLGTVWSRLRDILIDHSVWERRCIASGAFIAAILWFLPISYDVSQVDRVLATLVTAQASIVAIVFSVSILGVQLVANRYSARMTTLITSSISFQRTLLFLGISIGLDLLLLLQLPVLSPKTTMVGLAVIGGLAVASGIALIQYVEGTLERSTPEGLLQAYTNQLTADSYRDQVINSREQDGALHPMHELHSFVMSGLSNGEWATAENGLIEFERVSQGIIKELAGRGDLQRTDALAGHYFKTPIQEYLPRITAQAIEDGESDLARQAVQSIERITETGLKCYYPLLISSATSGLSRIIREAPDGEDGDSIRRRCLRVYSNLLTTVVGYPYPKGVVTLLSLYSSQFRKLLIRDREPWVYRHELEEFFRRSIGPAHKQTVEQYGQYISELDVDWHNRTQSMDAEGIAPYDMLFAYRRYSIEVIGYILNYYSRNEEWPLSPGVLRETWSNMLSDAISANTGRYSQAVCRWYIDLAYLICQAGDGNIGEWAVWLEKIEDDHGSAEMVDDAFNEALEKGMTAAFEGERRNISSASDSRSFFNKIMDLNPPGMEAYEDWVEQFHEHVIDHR